ncbi:hypothetical protein Ahy_A06g029969 [Arachis hypogaea]|uniref:FAR1 domain-containing protein n=1 Tax=Arachis hypogaea TaxID=3818 RepID=A0A445CUQ2_ARAHY|nr:hypothetical protein Ahy_A06g029969 [Arachis hypogaea]
MEEVHKMPNHDGICYEEIPELRMVFDVLQQAQEFYASYAKKVGFVTKIRNTNYDKSNKELKLSINQSIHCTREVNRATKCNKDVCHVGQGKDYLDDVKIRIKAFTSMFSIHYHQNRELSIHVKCVIEDNDEVRIRPNKTYLALTNEVGGCSNLNILKKDVKNDSFKGLGVPRMQ